MDLNLILQGWLIKSPPENKSAGPFKLFKAKWRRRWFVLYEPLASQSLPGTRAALDYYNNDRRQKKLGSIDLDHCEEVQFKLDSADYKHIFSLRTKHKGHDRTYFLSVASEVEMMKWVDCLCLALGLKENSEDIEPTQVPLNPQLGLPAQTSQLAAVGQPPLPPTVTDPPDSVLSASQPQCPNGGYNSCLSHGSQKPVRQTEIELTYQKSEAYIPLVDCYTGERNATHLRPGDKSGDHRASNDSIPSEPPPEPPVKSGRKLSEEVQHPGDPSLYDSPTKSYVNLGVDDNENVYKIPRSDEEGVYKIPSSASPDSQGLYKMPHPGQTGDWNFGAAIQQSDWSDGHKVDDGSDCLNDGDSGIYKIPRSDPVSDDDFYKVPPAIPCRGMSHSSHARPALPSAGVDQKEQDVSVFSQVPLPLASSTLAESVSARRSSPDGEVSPPHLHIDKTYRVPPPPVPLQSTGDVYDIPKSTSPLGQRPSSMDRVTMASLYDTPKSCLKSASDNTLLESVVPAPDKSQPSLRADDIPLPESRYENLQQSAFEDSSLPRRNEKLHSKIMTPSTRSNNVNYYNQQGLDNTHNIPPSKVCPKDKEKMVYIPPPPRTSQTSMTHSYINTLSSHNDAPHGRSDSFYMSMSLRNPDHPDAPAIETFGESYADMSNATSQLYPKPVNNRPVNPSVHDVVPPPSKREETYIFQTKRTRSFKRPLQPDHSDVVLPTRRTGMCDDISSSDEETSSSSSQHDKSADSISYKNYPPVANMTAKMGALNSTPPAPKHQGEIQYLDLALEEQSDNKGKNSLSLRTPASGNVSPTDYKEIDFVKTKALNETQKDVESKRKSSERSADE